MKSRIETSIRLNTLGIDNQLMIWNKQLVSDEALVTEFQTSADSPLLLLNSESTKMRGYISIPQFCEVS